MDRHFLLQRLFLTQGSNPHLLDWQVGSLPLNHLRSLMVNEVKSSIPLFNCRLCMLTSLQSEQYGKREGKKRVIVQWRNLTYYFIQMIKSTSVVVCHANTLYPWYNVMKMLLYFWDPPYPNPITLVASWEKHYTNSNSGTSYNITWPLLLKTDKVINTKEILKNCHNLEEPKEIQCNLVSWMWFWNRKRALDKNLRKSEYTIS